MKNIFPLILSAVLSLQAYAQDAPDWHIDWTFNQEQPNWQAPNASAFENFVVMCIKIEEALQPYATSDDMLAIFVDDELRGLAKPASVVDGNSSGDASTFVLKTFISEAVGDVLHVSVRYYNAQLKHIFTYLEDFVYDADAAIGLNEDFTPEFTLGSSKFPVVTTMDVDDILASSSITPANGDKIAAFVGDECRGVATFPLQGEDAFNVYKTDESETVTLKFYNAANQEVVTLDGGSGGDAAQKGDATGDGAVDVSDYIAIANYILGNPPAGFNAQAADVNGDGVVDVSDYIGVANIILYGNISGK